MWRIWIQGQRSARVPSRILCQDSSVFSTAIFLSSSSTKHQTTACAFDYAIVCPFPSFQFTELLFIF